MSRSIPALLLAGLLLAGCGIPSSPYLIGPQEPKPMVPAFDKAPSRPLHVYLSPRVPDLVVLEKPKYRTVHVQQFRKTLETGITNGIGFNFPKIIFDQTPDRSGLLLVIDYVVVDHSKVQDVYVGGGQMYEIAYTMDYNAVLTDGTFEIGRATQKVRGDETSWRIDEAPRLVKSAVEVMVKDLNNRLFTARAVRMVQ